MNKKFFIWAIAFFVIINIVVVCIVASNKTNSDSSDIAVEPQSSRIVSTQKTDSTPETVSAEKGKDGSEQRIEPIVITEVSAKAPSFGKTYVDLVLNRRADIESLRTGISFKPPVEFQVTDDSYEWWPHYTITGNFECGQNYKLTIAKGTLGLGKANSYAMSDLSSHFSVPEVTPTVKLSGAGRYLAPYGERIIPVQAVNVTNFTLSIDRVLPQNLLQFVMRDNGLYDNYYAGRINAKIEGLARNVAKFDLPVSTSVKNRTVYIPVSLKAYLKNVEYGAFLVSVRHNGDDNANRRGGFDDCALVCLTDLGVSARLDPDYAHVWVTSLLKGEARSGVTVALFSDRNEVIGTALSPKNGYVKIPYPSDMNPVAVIVQDQKTGDVSFLPLTNKAKISVVTSSTRDYLTGADCEAFLFTDRGIYRPGENVFLQGLLRERKFKAPTPFPAVLDVFGPDGKKVKTYSVMPFADGSFSQEFPISENMRLGTYRFALSTPGKNGVVLGQKSIAVESFVPPQIKVQLEDVPDAVFYGTSNLSSKVRAEYLFGGKASGLALSASCFPKKSVFKPKGWQNFTFCRSFESAVAFSGIIADVKNLDEDGVAEAVFNLMPVLNCKYPVELDIQASVIENSGRSVSEYKKVTVHPCPYYLGLSLPPDESFAERKPVQVFWTALDPNGKLAIPDGNLHAELYRVDSDWECTEGANGSFTWKHIEDVVPVDKNLPVSMIDATGTGSFFINPQRYGQYRIVLVDETTGASTAAEFDTWWWGDDSDSRVAEAGALTKVNITFDKKEYKPGDIAKIRVDSPFDGELWFLMHNTKVLASYTFPIRNKALEFTIKINETLAPNIEVSATVVRPTKVEEVWMPHRASGTASLNVRPVSHELDVTLKCDDAIKPLTALAGTVEVKDGKGRPVPSATVTVFAVDEGICQLTKHSVPDPAAYFRENRSSKIGYYDVYSDLMKVTDMSLVGYISHTGGDGSGADSNSLLKRLSFVKSRRFKPVSLRAVNVPVVNGKAYFSVDVPEFSGALRVMAVAWNDHAAGAAEKFTKVKRDVVLEPDMARFLAPGDSSFITMSLLNTTETFRGVRYAVSVESGPVMLSGESSGVCALGPHETKIVSIPFSAKQEYGVAKISFEVDTLSEKFFDEVEIPVRPAVALQSSAETLILAPSNSCRVAAAEGYFYATLDQKFNFLAFPACDVRNALAYLTEYPYGCLEQTTSRGFPFINAKRLPEGYLPAEEIARADSYIQSAIERIVLMKRENGFAMWPDVYTPNPFVTIYAVHFLAEARRAGYDIGIDVDTLVKIMLANMDKYTEYAACYAHLNLALLGKPAFAEMTTLLSSGKVGNEGLAILARAFIVGGQPSKGREILAKKVMKPKNLREAAFILSAWSEVNPNSIECVDAIKVINRFVDPDQHHWRTTQDNAIAVFALTSYMSTRTNMTIYDKASAKLEIIDDVHEGESFITFPESAETTWNVPASRNGASFIVSNPGSSTLFVNRTVSGIPLQEPSAENRGMKAERHYYTPAGKQTKLSTFKRGDIVVVQLVAKFNANFADVVIEDLLPACLEVEQGNAAALHMYPWMTEPSNWVQHSEIRDDRVLLFTNNIDDGDVCTWYYVARVVSAGDFAVPAVKAAAMYDPKAYSTGKSSTVSIR